MPVAIGDVTSFTSSDGKSVVLLAPAAATNSPPSGASAGLATVLLYNLNDQWPSVCSLQLYSTAGSGTMSVTCRLWGYLPNATGTGIWFPMGVGADSTKGTINAVSAIGETGTDVIRHTETVNLPCHFQRLYLEITAISGTGTSVTAELIARRGV